jgi:hypothetical protein
MQAVRRVAKLAMTISTAALMCTPLSAQENGPVAPAEDPLAKAFADPPAAARPHVWWHWMNGNVTKEGIASDLAWMKRIGIGGVQNFDASLETPQIVARRLTWMSPGWRDAFRFATSEAQRHGLDFAIASSPGWSETGGPWVAPGDAMKKLVWSVTEIDGGATVVVRLPDPPGVTGPYQSIARSGSLAQRTGGEARDMPRSRGDVRVIAFPVTPAAALPDSFFYDGAGDLVDAAAVSDGDFATVLQLPRLADPATTSLLQVFAEPVTIASARFFAPDQSVRFVGTLIEARLESSADGIAWQAVADIPVTPVQSTVSFAPVTAQYFRVVIEPQQRQPGGGRTPAPGAAPPARFAALAQGAAPATIPIAEFALSPVGTIDRFELKAGFAIAEEGPDGRQIPEMEGIDPEAVIDLTARMTPGGTLTWTPPEGRWKVLRLGWSLVGTTNHPASPEATGLEVDKYDSAAVRRYLETYLAMHADALGGAQAMRGRIDGLLTDSIEVDPANWTPELLAKFREMRGYDPVPWLPALTGQIVGSRQRSDAFLFDFRRTLEDLLASQHYATIAQVARERGLTVYGEALEDGRPVLGNDIAMRAHADIPMAAMWTFPTGGQPRANYLADIKGAASAANIHGKPLVAAESLTSAMQPWAQAPADLKHVVDLEFALGVNRPVIHTSVHQPLDDKAPGLSLFMFGQYFNRHETWAELAGPWVDYLARNALLLQQGRRVTDVAYFFGEETPLTALYGESPVADAPKTSDYDFIDAATLIDGLANDGADLVTPGGARYRALYLGGTSKRMTLPVLRRIAALAEAGATVIGTPPQDDPSLGADPVEFVTIVSRLWPDGESPVAEVGRGRVIASSDIAAALGQAGIAPDFRYSSQSGDAEILFQHRRSAQGDGYFLVNRKPRAERIEARFRVTGKAPDLWHADTGRIEPASFRIEGGETIVPLLLDPGEAVHVLFRRDTGLESLVTPVVEPRTLATIDGSWTVRFQPDRGAPAFIVLDALRQLDRHEQPGVRHFSGIATYEKVFSAPDGWKEGDPLWIDLGAVGDLAEVSVNGDVAGIAWHAPYRVDIGKLVRPGFNRLDVRVANLWVNRLIGDARAADGEATYTWTATPAYLPDAPLRRSGLVGPVRLISGE